MSVPFMDDHVCIILDAAVTPGNNDIDVNDVNDDNDNDDKNIEESVIVDKYMQ